MNEHQLDNAMDILNGDDASLDDWTDHWDGMPEFVQEKQEPFAKIIVRFETEEDLQDFSDRIGQTLTPKTKSIWHPYKPHRLPSKKVWRDAK